MVDRSGEMNGLPLMTGLLQRIEHETGVRRPAPPSAGDPAGLSVDDDSHLHEAGPGSDAGEVRGPKQVRLRRIEGHVYMTERARRRFVTGGHSDRLAADDALQAHLQHQPEAVQRAKSKPSRYICRYTLRVL